MADTVDTKVLFNGTRRYVTKWTNISDGTGESAVDKLTISGLVAPSGAAPSKVVCEEIQWSITGFAPVRLHWDATTDDELAMLAPGNGYMSFTAVGGNLDPQSTGFTGNVNLTWTAPAAGDTYDITIVWRLKD